MTHSIHSFHCSFHSFQYQTCNQPIPPPGMALHDPRIACRQLHDFPNPQSPIPNVSHTRSCTPWFSSSCSSHITTRCLLPQHRNKLFSSDSCNHHCVSCVPFLIFAHLFHASFIAARLLHATFMPETHPVVMQGSGGWVRSVEVCDACDCGHPRSRCWRL